MAEAGSFLRPQEGQDDSEGSPRPASGPPDSNGLLSRWGDWVDKPDNRAALMQFGAAMLQPMGVGDTGMAHFGRAVTQGGEAAGRVQAQQLREREASSKEELRAAQAQNAESRAGAAGERALRYADMASNAAERLSLQRQILSQRDYRDYAAAKAKHDLLNPNEPFQSYEDWQAARGATPTDALGLPKEANRPSQQDAIAQGRAAIARGIPRDRVIQRLREKGYDPSGL